MKHADEASPVKELVGLLRQQALEIANEGHNGWGNTMEEAADALERERRRTDWYRFRCEALQQALNGMRDPERKMVCDILANDIDDEVDADNLDGGKP
jgi:hypothetical protein